MQWPITIPLVVVLPCLLRQPKARRDAWYVAALYALGWTGCSIQCAFNPPVVAPKTSIWTCNSRDGGGRERHYLDCVDAMGHVYTVEASDSSPLRVSFLGTLWPFRGNAWRQFNHSKGLHGTIRSTMPVAQSPLDSHVNTGRDKPLWKFLQAHFTGPIPGLLLAIFSGEKQQLDASLKIRLAHAGLAHLMAVSGYHVGLVTFPFLLLLRHRRTGTRLMGFTGILITWSFIAYCGFPISAVRAGLMITGYGLSQLMRLNLSAMQLLSIAAWGMLIYNPTWARDLGMQLSFVAVYAILLGIQLVKGSQNRHPLMVYFIVPIAAQVGTGCIAWPTFGVFPKFFLFFNWIASPIMAFLGAAFASSLGAEFILDWKECANLVTNVVNQAIHVILEPFDSWHSSSWTWDLRTVDKPLLMAVSLGFLIGGTLAVAGRFARRQFLIIYGGLCAALFPWIGWQMNTRAAVSYRYGLVLDAATCCSGSLVTAGRDSIQLSAKHAKFGTTPPHNPPLLPRPIAALSSETWAIAPTANTGIGKLKSRPFAWKRVDGSLMLFSFGQDTMRLTRWERPTILD